MSVVLSVVIKWSNNTTFSLNQRVLAGVTSNLVDKQQQRLVVPSRWSRLVMKPNKSHQERRYKTETSNQCFLIGLSFLIGLVPIRTIRTINRPLIGLIVHIIVQHIAGLYKYISYMYGIYIIYHIRYIYIVDIEHISS